MQNVQRADVPVGHVRDSSSATTSKTALWSTKSLRVHRLVTTRQLPLNNKLVPRGWSRPVVGYQNTCRFLIRGEKPRFDMMEDHGSLGSSVPPTFLFGRCDPTSMESFHGLPAFFGVSDVSDGGKFVFGSPVCLSMARKPSYCLG